jgi:DNA-damage-inducible protein J
MSTADTDVRARIDTETKERAAAALDAMGLTLSDGIRLFLRRVADEQRLPFEVRVPNAVTRQAMADAESGRDVKRFSTVDALMADLNADD